MLASLRRFSLDSKSIRNGGRIQNMLLGRGKQRETQLHKPRQEKNHSFFIVRKVNEAVVNLWTVGLREPFFLDWCLEQGVKYPGPVVKNHKKILSVYDCQKACRENPKCDIFVYNKWVFTLFIFQHCIWSRRYFFSTISPAVWSNAAWKRRPFASIGLEIWIPFPEGEDATVRERKQWTL